MKWQKIIATTALGAILAFGSVANTHAQNQPIGKDRAAAIAQESMNGAIPLEIEFDRAKGQEAYEVGFANGTDVYIGKFTGDVLKKDRSSADRSDRRTARVAAQTPDRVGFSEAANVAQQAVDGARVSEVELALEDGQLMYEVDLAGDTYVYVWAVSGEVYEVEYDDWD